jgi:hypothetical protein
MINAIIIEARFEGLAMQGQLINKQTITRIHARTLTHTHTQTRTHGAQIRRKQKITETSCGN